jgi:hypothetical protein
VSTGDTDKLERIGFRQSYQSVAPLLLEGSRLHGRRTLPTVLSHRVKTIDEAAMKAMKAPDRGQGTGGRSRDPRLDFFRGLAMFIILLAHIPINPWTLWIPARFGFSDATEIFVFCSGMASAYAFGSVFASRGLMLGTMRVVYRVWQVYWAHIGVFLISVCILVAIDINGWGAGDISYITRPYVVPFFDQTGQTLIGLLTLRYVPGLFDILPMYLVILAMIPVVMTAHGQGGTGAVVALVLCMWLLATLAGHPRITENTAPWLGEGGMALAARLSVLNLPGLPGRDVVWFFNPFAWQLIFFTGFAFGMGWLPAPPVSRRLALIAAGVLVLSLPLAWHALHQPWALEPGTVAAAVQGSLSEALAHLAPLVTKTWFGALRYVHFLALAYLAWLAVGPRGERLSAPLALREVTPSRRSLRLGLGGMALLLTTPYAHIEVIARDLPALDGWLVQHWPLFGDGRLALMKLVHYISATVVLWHLLPRSAQYWLCGRGWAHAVRIIRKVGTQSLAVFMTSIPLAIICGWVLDWIGRGAVSVALVNLCGFAILIATAYFCGWIKGHPWRQPVVVARPGIAASPTPAE